MIIMMIIMIMIITIIIIVRRRGLLRHTVTTESDAYHLLFQGAAPLTPPHLYYNITCHNIT